VSSRVVTTKLHDYDNNTLRRSSNFCLEAVTDSLPVEAN
jgi:hypothetical protein